MTDIHQIGQCEPGCCRPKKTTAKDATKEPTAAEMVVQIEGELQTALKQGRWADSEGLDNQLHEYRRQVELAELRAERDKLLSALQKLENIACRGGLLGDEERVTPWPNSKPSAPGA